ncbi:MAG: class I SAM-dependent methyltransferase, partial [Actinobacteria bacterium]|nr:class I SAM-dependent methyltransferase [Actinomycetota bacterium]
MTDLTVPTPTGRHRGTYGVDAPYVPALLLIAAAACVGFAATSGQWLQWLPAIVVLGGSGVVYLHTTLRGKFVVWDRLADGLDLRGDESVLDVGCGRGMVLTAVAGRLTSGRATGVDIWSSHDQSGNDMTATSQNAELEGVSDRVVLETGDMRSLPFADSTFDVIVT